MAEQFIILNYILNQPEEKKILVKEKSTELTLLGDENDSTKQKKQMIIIKKRLLVLNFKRPA